MRGAKNRREELKMVFSLPGMHWLVHACKKVVVDISAIGPVRQCGPCLAFPCFQAGR